jgi:hypothetical protein
VASLIRLAGDDTAVVRVGRTATRQIEVWWMRRVLEIDVCMGRAENAVKVAPASTTTRT